MFCLVFSSKPALRCRVSVFQRARGFFVMFANRLCFNPFAIAKVQLFSDFCVIYFYFIRSLFLYICRVFPLASCEVFNMCAADTASVPQSHHSQVEPCRSAPQYFRAPPSYALRASRPPTPKGRLAALRLRP